MFAPARIIPPPPPPGPFRLLTGLKQARRTEALYHPKPSNAAAAIGLQFERRIKRELVYHAAMGRLGVIEHNPWFVFADSRGSSQCCPDFLIWTPAHIVVVEVKLTWVPEALEKLTKLYCPIIGMALERETQSLVICRHLALGAPAAVFGLAEALASPDALLHWPNNGHIPW